MIREHRVVRDAFLAASDSCVVSIRVVSAAAKKSHFVPLPVISIALLWCNLGASSLIILWTVCTRQKRSFSLTFLQGGLTGTPLYKLRTRAVFCGQAWMRTISTALSAGSRAPSSNLIQKQRLSNPSGEPFICRIHSF